MVELVPYRHQPWARRQEIDHRAIRALRPWLGKPAQIARQVGSAGRFEFESFPGGGRRGPQGELGIGEWVRARHDDDLVTETPDAFGDRFDHRTTRCDGTGPR